MLTKKPRRLPPRWKRKPSRQTTSRRNSNSLWQARWREASLYKTEETEDSRKTYYCLDFFPYLSGDGLSVGHCHNYIPTDVISRHMRMRGFNVLHPMGWDAFGLPAENRARDTGIAPRLTVDQNTANYKRQLDLIGCSYDWGPRDRFQCAGILQVHPVALPDDPPPRLGV